MYLAIKKYHFKRNLPVVFLAPSFQVSGVMTRPSFFSPVGHIQT